MVSESVCSSSCVSSAKGTRRPDHSSSSFAAESSTHGITQRGIPTVDIPTLSPAPVVSQDASRITSPYLCGDSPDKCQASRHLPPQQLGLTSGQVTMTMAQKTVQRLHQHKGESAAEQTPSTSDRTCQTLSQTQQALRQDTGLQGPSTANSQGPCHF